MVIPLDYKTDQSTHIGQAYLNFATQAEGEGGHNGVGSPSAAPSRLMFRTRLVLKLCVHAYRAVVDMEGRSLCMA